MKNFHIENKAGAVNIKIIGSISNWKNSSEEFTRMVDEVIASGMQDADIYLNCYGGSVIEANEIINQLMRFKGTIKITLGAIAASAGFTIAVKAGTKENTYCHSNTQCMYHDISGFVPIARLEDFDSYKKQFSDARKNVVSILAKRMGLSEDEVSENMAKTTWLNTTELVKYSIVGKDNILDSDDKAPKGTKNELQNMGVDAPLLFNEIIDEAEKPQNLQNKETNTTMKDIAKKLGLSENATPEEINAAIENLQNKESFANECLVNQCIEKGIKKEAAEKSVASNFTGTQELINGMEDKPSADEDEEEEEDDKAKNNKKPSSTRPSNILDALKNELGLNGGGSPANKKLEDYTNEELDKMESEDPEKFEKLFNESEFGSVDNPKS